MQTYVALLRGINVGRGNRVPMADLRRLLETLGYRDVSTLLNSGNVVFRAPADAAVSVEGAIAGALSKAMGVIVSVIVTSAQQFRYVIDANPNAAVADPPRLLVAFSSRQEEIDALQALGVLLTPGEFLHVRQGAAYLHCASGILESKAAAALLGKLGRNVTTRNWATVLKIAAALERLPPDAAFNRVQPGLSQV